VDDSLMRLLEQNVLTAPPKPSLGELLSPSPLAPIPYASLLPTVNALLAPGLSTDVVNALMAGPPRATQPAPVANLGGAVVSPMLKRKVYFAFDFDDLIRVNNVRQVGKIGPREQKNARAFYDRSIWESRDINTVNGLKAFCAKA